MPFSPRVSDRRRVMNALAPAPESALRSELELIQGAWQSVAGPREARLLVAGNRFTIEFGGGDIYMGTFELATGQMDMHIEAGPAEHVGTHSLCIYQLD